MVREICRDKFFLQLKAEPATREDMYIGHDLLDTLKAHSDECVGMAANMIGVNKSIIIINTGMFATVMYNPVIVKKSFPYETEEGCLSLDGKRKTTRYAHIEVEYRDMRWKKERRSFTGWIAQIIQHEYDHTQGILI